MEKKRTVRVKLLLLCILREGLKYDNLYIYSNSFNVSQFAAECL